jgi:carboxypeptidase Taq
MSQSSAYAQLERRFARKAALADAEGILSWDSQTMMPSGAAKGREEQLATLQLLQHEILTAPDMGDLLDAAQAADDGSDPWKTANLREMRRTWRHATVLPDALVEATSRANSRCENVWRTAKPASDFAALRPHLEEVLRLQREAAAAKSGAMGLTPYDALLDLYEPGGRSAAIDGLFDALAGTLPELIGTIIDRQAAAPAPVPLDGPFPIDVQRGLGERLMRAVGFDTDRGRLDVSLHPFCGGATGDVRITTRYSETGFTGAMLGVLHEAGHAVYEQNRPEAWAHQPVGQARGMVAHESQSLIVEMQASRSRPFVAWLAGEAARAFGREGPAWTAENLVRHYRRVERSFIRVDADEVTYPAHVILRYRLERAMIAGDLAVADLPDAWNAGMRDLLGVVPPDHARGCLQDIHWPAGLFGYFPCYTLGAMMAAQLFETATAEDPAIVPALAEGRFDPLVGWLKPRIHAKASFADTDTLLREATGRSLDADVFMRHLRRRYLGED